LLWPQVEAVVKLGALGRPRKDVCVTLNPVVRDLLARANHRLQVAGDGGATADGHVTSRRPMLIDIDSVKRAAPWSCPTCPRPTRSAPRPTRWPAPSRPT
jgi:hypothetical protein